MFTLGVRAQCPSTITDYRSFKDPPHNSPTMSVPKYKVGTLYSGAKVGVYILGTQCLNTAPFCVGAQALVLAHQV